MSMQSMLIPNTFAGESLHYLCNHQIVVPEWVTNQLLQYLTIWQKVHPKENTFAQTKYGVPSIIVRVEYMFDEAAQRVYPVEIEGKPCGLGIIKNYNDLVQPTHAWDRLQKILSLYPSIYAVIADLNSPNERLTDDQGWTTKLSYTQAVQLMNADPSALFVLRSRLGDTRFNEFASRSVSLVATEGDKSYGYKLGFYYEGFGDQNRSDVLSYPLVIKPKVGTRCMGVSVYIPPDHNLAQLVANQPKRDKNKIITDPSKAAKLIENNKYFWQYFAMPCEGVPYTGMWGMPRDMFVWHPVYECWFPIGGLFNAVPYHFLIHGSPESVFSDLCLSQNMLRNYPLPY